MRKQMVRNLAYVVFLLLLASPLEGAFASSTGQTTNPSTSSSPAPAPNAQGITGTDPEPISPSIVSIIFTLLQLS